jgi:hypothetical protein
MSWLATGPNFWTDLVQFAVPVWALLFALWTLFR